MDQKPESQFRKIICFGNLRKRLLAHQNALFHNKTNRLAHSYQQPTFFVLMKLASRERISGLRQNGGPVPGLKLDVKKYVILGVWTRS